VRRGRITNHRLISYSLSNISAKNYENRFVFSVVIMCYISVVFLRHSVHIYIYISWDVLVGVVDVLVGYYSVLLTLTAYNTTVVLPRSKVTSDVTEPAKIRIGRCAQFVICGFVVQSKLVPAVIATVIQLSYLKLKLQTN